MSESKRKRPPYPLGPKVIDEWSASRTGDLRNNPTGSTAVYHEAGNRRLKPPAQPWSWEAATHANLVLAIRLAAQNEFGPDGAKRVTDALAEALEDPEVADIAPHVLPYKPKGLHATMLYEGLQQLTDYGLPDDYDALLRAQGEEFKKPARSWQKMVADVVTENENLISGVRDAVGAAPTFTLRLQGFQVLGNSIVAKARFGGDKVNELVSAINEKVPGMKGNDPTRSPLDKNPDTKAWGMAAHVTVAIFGGKFTNEQALKLQEALDKVELDVEVPVSHLSLDLQAFRDVETPDGRTVGGPLEHIARIAEFGLTPEVPYEKDLPVDRTVSSGLV